MDFSPTDDQSRNWDGSREKAETKKTFLGEGGMNISECGVLLRYCTCLVDGEPVKDDGCQTR